MGPAGEKFCHNNRYYFRSPDTNEFDQCTSCRTGSESCFRCTWFYRYECSSWRQLEVLSGRKLTLPLEQLIVPQLLLRRDQEPRRVLLLVLLCQPQRTRPLKLSINDLQAGGMKTDKPITTSIWAVLIVSAFSIVVVAFFGSQIVQYHKSEITQGQVVAIDYPKVIVSYDDRINGPRNGIFLGDSRTVGRLNIGDTVEIRYVAGSVFYIVGRIYRRSKQKSALFINRILRYLCSLESLSKIYE